jgi:hypothetical protein
VITELVLLLSIFAFMIMGVFLGPVGPIQTFQKAAPRLGARVERNISVGDGFRHSANDGKGVTWSSPSNP